ncbi:DEAD/DEAH box helicase [Shewanella sp. Scap07]|uniref:DEAD/DEAH box helicase n=1 Tax=Shewanella sp. Scap07 TaxID=2589987 RepID=UPI0015BEFA83|nr:DEAD/DEAH box helicase [Shewanella sp. Scap07]QLE86347.1 DEAD/DEAH box helicase [Shewanella sp. Scap07]
MTFDSFPLSSQLIDAIAICGYQNLTPVQQQVMPIALARHDVIACAQTGTGKTAAYAIPMLQWLLDNADDSQSIKALVMTPTRELAIQVAENIQQYSQFAELKTVAVYGGANINPQRKAIAAGADILVATPGRLFDIIGQYSVDLSSVDTLIIDEADRMLDLGFVKDIERIKKHLKPQHCCQLFSATYSEGIAQLAHKMLNAPQKVNIEPGKQAATIEQWVYPVDKRRKAELLAELIGRNNWRQVLVFVSTKESAELLLQELHLDGLKGAVFHGDKTQGARNRALEQFKSGELRILVATDVAARGLDIEALPLVINLELPFAAEDYVHRIGRTGRAGMAGKAISFVSRNDEVMLADIEALIGQVIDRKVQPGYEEGAPLPERYRQLLVEPKAKKTFKHKSRSKSKRATGKGGYAARRANQSR